MEAIKFTSSTSGELILTNEVVNRLAAMGYTPERLNEEINKHAQTHGYSPALYCGTYGKYNEGNLGGMWVNVSTVGSYEDFINFCKAIHADENDPELMYQDFANMPRSLYHESMGAEEFENILKYCDLCDEYNVLAVDDFLELYKPEDLDMMSYSYVGVYDSREEFAEEKAIEDFNPEKMMGDFACYFDYEDYARDLFFNDYRFGSHGSVFARF